jgi:hypothetical protein
LGPRQPHACRAPPSPRVQPPAASAAPFAFYRQHRDVEAPEVSRTRFATYWRTRSSLDRLLKTGAISAYEYWQATIPRPGREGGALRNPGVKLGDDPRWAPLPPAAARPERAGLGRLAQLRVIEEVLGETVYSLALAVIGQERSFIAIGKQFGCDARTIKKWSAAAVAALAVV